MQQVTRETLLLPVILVTMVDLQKEIVHVVKGKSPKAITMSLSLTLFGTDLTATGEKVLF